MFQSIQLYKVYCRFSQWSSLPGRHHGCLHSMWKRHVLSHYMLLWGRMSRKGLFLSTCRRWIVCFPARNAHISAVWLALCCRPSIVVAVFLNVGIFAPAFIENLCALPVWFANRFFCCLFFNFFSFFLFFFFFFVCDAFICCMQFFPWSFVAFQFPGCASISESKLKHNFKDKCPICSEALLHGPCVYFLDQ